MPVITADQLQAFTVALFQAVDVPAEHARLVARSLVGANLRGHDSHGAMRIPFYVNAIRTGKVLPRESLRIERETPAALTCDGGWGLGQVLVYDMMARLMGKAEAVGVAAGVLRRAAHIGRLGEYAELAAEKGLTAIIIANSHGSGLRVAPVGGTRGRLGTNPICIGVPGGAEGPFILDFGTSATAEGKVRVKKIAGQPVPLGWILDPDGNPTTDPNKLYGDPPGSILPLGGDQAYKGFGLAFMIELLCGGLSGSPCSFAGAPAPMGNSALFLVLAPGHFSGSTHLRQEVSALERFVRETPRRSGVERITLPGDPERHTLEQRQQGGIALDDGNWQALLKLAEELHVTAPAV